MKLGRSLSKNRMFVRSMQYIPDSLLMRLRKSPLITIEPTNFCNLKCPLCPTNNLPKRKKGFMTLENFKTIIDEIKSIKSYIMMDFAGEPTLNKDLLKMIRYAADNGLKTQISTNATLLHKLGYENIIESGLTHLVLAVDGITRETEEKYRVGANFNQVMENMRGVVDARKKLKSKTPEIDWQFVVMEHNQHEIPEVVNTAKEIGIDVVGFKSLSILCGYEFSKEEFEEIQKKTGIRLPSEEFRRKRAEKPLLICPWIWQSVIYWNGDVAVCCHDFNGEIIIGNVFRDGGFKKVWKSKKYGGIRKQILKGELKICKNCEMFGKSDNLGRTIDLRKL